MLYEIQCDQFAEIIKGERIPRAAIRFHPGLNTVLGDKNAQNSIGKSTFLMIIDFCFGGDDYVNPDKCNAKEYIHTHTINFAFNFDGQIDYFSRCTATPYEIHICSKDYLDTGEILTLDEFREYLLKKYKITLSDISFRNIVGRYIRVYGRENYFERRPLEYGKETDELAIEALEKLFGVYAFIHEYKTIYEDKRERSRVRKRATDLGEFANIARNKTQVKENEKEIERLEGVLSALTKKQDIDLSAENSETVKRASVLKGRIRSLSRKRSRINAQLEHIKVNASEKTTITRDDFDDLAFFFPSVNMRQLEMVEQFHKKIHFILTAELEEEQERLELMLKEITEELDQCENLLRELGVPANIPKSYIDQIINLQRQIDLLKTQNEAFHASETLKAQVKQAKAELESAREAQLSIVERTINEELVRLNDIIYANATNCHHAPSIKFENANSGKPKYTYKTEADGGTGTNFKGLILFDLSLLRLTQLPFVVHDSLIFKNIGDLPIDQIMEMYSKSAKQIFIAFDKKDAFSEKTKSVIDSTTVLELHEHGGELFGWSWAEIKDNDDTSDNV